MGTKITGKEYSLSQIFSKEFEYFIPTYQRPYAWTESETETLSGNSRISCDKYLNEPGDEFEQLDPTPRLHLRQKDQSFFNQYIQKVNIDELAAIDEETLPNESQKHIRSNSILM